MPTEWFRYHKQAEEYARNFPGSYIARDPAGIGWIVVRP